MHEGYTLRREDGGPVPSPYSEFSLQVRSLLLVTLMSYPLQFVLPVKQILDRGQIIVSANFCE